MTPPGRCPHCGARISGWRILRVTRRDPYRCEACGRQAVIHARSGMAAVVASVALIAVPLLALDLLGAPPVALFMVCVAGVLASPAVFARLCRFERQEPGE